jgi:hypothetical protein
MGYKLFGIDSDLEYKLDQKITEQQQMKEIISDWGQRKGKDMTNVISKNEFFMLNSRQDTRYRPTFSKIFYQRLPQGIESDLGVGK